MLWPKANVMQMFWLECQMSLLEGNTQIFTVWNTEIYYSKVAKNKQKPTFCQSWFNCCGNWLHLGFSWKIPCNFFFLTFSVYGKHVVDKGPESHSLLEEKTGDVRLGALCLSTVPWLTQQWYDTLSFALWSCFMARVSSQGGPASRKSDCHQNRHACMENILYPRPLVIHNQSVNSANVGGKKSTFSFLSGFFICLLAREDYLPKFICFVCHKGMQGKTHILQLLGFFYNYCFEHMSNIKKNHYLRNQVHWEIVLQDRLFTLQKTSWENFFKI